MITEYDKLSMKHITFFTVKTFLTQSISKALRSISGITRYLTGGWGGSLYRLIGRSLLSPTGFYRLYHLVNHTPSAEPLAPAAYLPAEMHALAHFYDGWSWFVKRKKKPLGSVKLIQHVITIRLLEGWSVLEIVKRLNKQRNAPFPLKHTTCQWVTGVMKSHCAHLCLLYAVLTFLKSCKILDRGVIKCKIGQSSEESWVK